LKSDVTSLRKDYGRFELDHSKMDPDPIVFFEKWMEEAINAELPDPTAMTLSTVSADGFPSSRIVLLKGVENGCFTFFTNYESKKGTELIQNLNGALTFFWPQLERQVNITGQVEKTSNEQSDEYFASRPRKSQLGAWASKQGEELSSRIELMKDFGLVSLKYLGRKVPRPPFWGGFQLEPRTIEFWQGRPSRLHDRMLYSKSDDQWVIKRLSP